MVFCLRGNSYFIHTENKRHRQTDRDIQREIETETESERERESQTLLIILCKNAPLILVSALNPTCVRNA